MVINITLGLVIGFAVLDCAVPGRVAADAACGFICNGLAGASCAKAEHPAARAITTVNRSRENQRSENRRAGESAERRVERRPNMRLLRRRLLLCAPRLLVCFRRQSLGGQSLG